MPATINIRRDLLYDNLLGWIGEHTEGVVDYANALKNCGFTAEEITEELIDHCCYEGGEVTEILIEIGMAEKPQDKQITIDLSALDRELGSYQNAFGMLSIQYKTLSALLEKCRVDR